MRSFQSLPDSFVLFSDTSTGTGNVAGGFQKAPCTIHFKLNGSGAVSAQISVYGSNVAGDTTSGVLLARVTLGGTNIASDLLAINVPPSYIWITLDSVSSSTTATATLGA